MRSARFALLMGLCGSASACAVDAGEPLGEAAGALDDCTHAFVSTALTHDAGEGSDEADADWVVSRLWAALGVRLGDGEREGDGEAAGAAVPDSRGTGRVAAARARGRTRVGCGHARDTNSEPTVSSAPTTSARLIPELHRLPIFVEIKPPAKAASA